MRFLSYFFLYGLIKVASSLEATFKMVIGRGEARDFLFEKNRWLLERTEFIIRLEVSFLDR